MVEHLLFGFFFHLLRRIKKRVTTRRMPKSKLDLEFPVKPGGLFVHAIHVAMVQTQQAHEHGNGPTIPTITSR